MDDARSLRDALRYEFATSGHRLSHLPDEYELSKIFGCSRNVLREALNLLRGEHLIERRQGSGTRVVGEGMPLMASETDSLRVSLNADPARVHYEMLGSTETWASGAIAQTLGVEERSPLLVLGRVTFVDNRPTCIWDTFLSREIGQKILASRCTGDYYELLRDALGLLITEIKMRVEAVGADPSVSEILRVEIGQPLLRFERVTYDEHHRAIALSFGRARADKVALTLSGRRVLEPLNSDDRARDEEEAN
jgi:GntR family transcriptional regulator